MCVFITIIIVTLRFIASNFRCCCLYLSLYVHKCGCCRCCCGFSVNRNADLRGCQFTTRASFVCGVVSYHRCRSWWMMMIMIMMMVSLIHTEYIFERIFLCNRKVSKNKSKKHETEWRQQQQQRRVASTTNDTQRHPRDKPALTKRETGARKCIAWRIVNVECKIFIMPPMREHYVAAMVPILCSSSLSKEF